jgi:hypothetical protein
MKFGIIGLMALVLLSGCAQEVSRAKPDIVNYTQKVMDKAADEIDGGSCPVLGDTFMPDYQVMRDQVRAL